MKTEQLVEIVEGQTYPILFATISGAHLYGFPSPDSGYDLRGVHILPLDQVTGLDPIDETIEISKVEKDLELDLVTHDVKKFFLMLLKRNGYVLEQLFSPLVIHSTPEFIELKKIAKSCITKHHAHHYLGFSETQWQLFNKQSPRRVKPLLYVYRVLLTGIHLMKTGVIECNLSKLNQDSNLPYLKELIEIKTSSDEQTTLDGREIEFYQSEYLRLRSELEDCHQKSQLPDSPSAREALNDLLIRIRKNVGWME